MLSKYFTYIRQHYLHLEKGLTLHLNKRKFPYTTNDFGRVGRNWPSGSGEDSVLKISLTFWIKFTQGCGK